MTVAPNPILRVAAAPALLARGCVNVIGLAEIRAEMGALWEKRREAVWARLESMLSHKLGSMDFYVRLDDLSYLVSMPTVLQVEAQIFCLRIAYDLYGSLLGQCDIAKLRIAKAVTLQNDVVRTTPITGEALMTLAARAGLCHPVGGSAPGPTGTATPLVKAAEPFRHRFTPLWDAPKEAVTTYRITSSADHAASEIYETHAKFELAMALSRVAMAARQLSTRLATGDRVMVWIPLLFELLSSPIGRMEIAGACRSLSAELRPYLIFEICGLPHGVPQSRLSEMAGSLRPFCRAVSATVPNGTLNYGAYLGAGLQAIGLAVPQVDGTDVSADVMRLSVAARKQHIVSYLLDVPQHELLQSAISVGINLLSSPLIGRACNELASIRRLNAQDVFQGPATRQVA
jgi:hypothetical protein